MKIATLSRQINLKGLFLMKERFKKKKSLSLTPTRLCMIKRDTRETGREKRDDGGVEKEKLEQSILSIPVLISGDCDGSGGHTPVIESC